MSKAIKQMQMNSLKATFKDVRDMVLLNVVGLDAITENQLRLSLRKKKIYMQTVKNSLARRVFADLGMKIESPWGGATTVAWGANSIADLAKEIEPIVKKHEKVMKVKTAVFDGDEVAFAQALKMPTRTQAIGTVVMLALSPARRIAGAIIGPAGKVSGAVKAVSEKKEEAAPAPSA